MRDDLLDALTCVEWAESQLNVFSERIKGWINSRPYSATIKKDSQGGEDVWHIEEIDPFPRIITAEAGIIIHSIRSSLDLLANCLAERNGQLRKKDVYFPICNAIDKFNSSGRDKIKRLSATDQAAIERLQPYNGGDIPILLWALHDLDVMRKHQRLMQAHSSPHGLGIYKYGSFLPEIDAVMRSQPPDDGYVLPRGPANPDYQIQIRIEVAFSNVGRLSLEPAALVLKKFSDAAKAIIGVFDTP